MDRLAGNVASMKKIAMDRRPVYRGAQWQMLLDKEKEAGRVVEFDRERKDTARRDDVEVS
jgi:hypothetical protein